MKIKIFTLPTCPICTMVKKKLKDKNIEYEEMPFEALPKEIETDRAPVLYNGENYLLSPSAINNWIKGV